MTCAKRLVVALLLKGAQFWVGSNWCHSPQEICPRKENDGYEICDEICKINDHAEIEALKKALDEVEDLEGGELYLFGHTLICEDCLHILKDYKIKVRAIIPIEGEYK